MIKKPTLKPLSKPSAKSVTIGIDLGATKVEMAMVDAAGGILGKHRYPTNARHGAPEIIAAIVRAVEKCRHKSNRITTAVGIGVAGQVDAATGTVGVHGDAGDTGNHLDLRNNQHRCTDFRRR